MQAFRRRIHDSHTRKMVVIWAFSAAGDRARGSMGLRRHESIINSIKADIGLI